jgi:Lipocalin-like domain
MNRRATLAMATAALLRFAAGLSASDALAQQTLLKEQLVGTWLLVSSDQVRPDGSKLKQFGANPKGINVFDANGRFFVMIASADNSKIAARDKGEFRGNRRPDRRVDCLLRHVYGQRGEEGCPLSS